MHESIDIAFYSISIIDIFKTKVFVIADMM